METNNTYTPDMAELKPKREYDGRDRALIPAALIVGLLFRICFEPDTYRGAGLVFAAMWAVYAVGYFIARRGRTIEPPARLSWLPIIAAALLSARWQVYAEQTLGTINFLAVPMLMMLHWALADLGATDGGWDVAKRFFMGWFVMPFTSAGHMFMAAGSLFKRTADSEKRKNLLIGLGVGVPLVIVVLALLISGDGVLGYYFDHAFENVGVVSIAGYITVTVVAGMLFYSFLYNTKHRADISPAKGFALPAAAGRIVLVMLLAVYALFAAVQFTYLTGILGLPAELTYSEYAVSGFTEMSTVAVINLALMAVLIPSAKDDGLLKGLCFGLAAANGVVLFSGIMRLTLYISAYGLTIARILPMWFMIFLAAATLIAAARLVRPFRALLVIMGVFIVWYIALNAVNVDAIIAKSVLDRAEAAGGLTWNDRHFLNHEVSSDADAVIADSPFDITMD